MHTQDVAEANIEKIGQLFPNCLTERIIGKDKDGKDIIDKAIDFDKLKQELSKEIVEGNQERYQFTWPGKREAMRLANTPTNMTLRPDRESSVDFDNTENLYIEGDNLEVLKLLRENYLGKVKMIYIDPPYNTGSDFVYEDNFSETVGEFMDKSGMFDENGKMLLDKYTVNSESNGRFHTDWLNMMYPRLKVSKDLLAANGVLFISIDENEVQNMKRLCTEIFGEQNFVDCLHWKKKKQPSFLAKHTAKVMEYVLVVAKNKEHLEKLSIETLSDATKKVINISNNECLRHFKSGVRVKIGDNGVLKSGRYRIKTMDVEYLSDVVYRDGRSINEVDVIARFSVSQDKINKFIDDDLLFITANNGLRRDVSEEETNNRKSITDLLLSEYGDNQDSDNEFKELFDDKYFDYTKPVALIYNFIKSNYTEDQIILDFFSGSSTTAHSVMKLNSEDNGKRRFILVQLPERTKEESAAFKAGYYTICDIGKERIRRAAKIIINNQGVQTEDLFEKGPDRPLSFDTGFRVLKLDTSNMQDVYYTPEASSENTLFEDNVKPDRTPEDLLFQVMLECNLPLSAKIEKKTIAGKEVFNVNDGYLLACFDEDVNETVITEVAKQKPYYFIMRDKSLSSDNVADNFEQIFNAYSKDTIRKIL